MLNKIPNKDKPTIGAKMCEEKNEKKTIHTHKEQTKINLENQTYKST